MTGDYATGVCCVCGFAGAVRRKPGSAKADHDLCDDCLWDALVWAARQGHEDLSYERAVTRGYRGAMERG